MINKYKTDSINAKQDSNRNNESIDLCVDVSIIFWFINNKYVKFITIITNF